MRQGKYLNVILTANAVLLAGLLWTQVAQRPLLAGDAVAQSPGVPGIPNAAEQRQKMIEAMRDIKASVDATKQAIQGGKIKVEVTNIDQLKSDDKKE
jgi:hypothetical protein